MAGPLTSLEICAGGGGQALGLEMAGFEHAALLEIDPHACATLRLNRPHWKVLHQDIRDFHAHAYRDIDLLAGGVPCPPFSKAGYQLGRDDERDMFPEALRLVEECMPRAVMLENVRGLLDPAFDDYRDQINLRLRSLGYAPRWKLLQASDFGVPQLRPRVVMVALRDEIAACFDWPESGSKPPQTVGQVLGAAMSAGGWEGVTEWAQRANTIAPTLVGGSKKHGGPDLGPTRARKAWASLGVDGLGLADAPPPPGFSGMPKLTVPMAAALQGFPPEWRFAGGKTAAYRQVGNAFPPPVAAAVGGAIVRALHAYDLEQLKEAASKTWQPVLVREPSFATT